MPVHEGDTDDRPTGVVLAEVLPVTKKDLRAAERCLSSVLKSGRSTLSKSAAGTVS
jgi:hypothetical protein